MARPGGLGRGLGALIPTGTVAEQAGGLADIPISEIRPNPQQPREHFDEEALAALADSIREVGILQPVLVRAAEDSGYELIAGERRLRAAVRAGLEKVPVIVREADPGDRLELALIENVQRENLTALEEAEAYRHLGQEYGFTQEEIAARVGKSRPAITNSLRLLGLPDAVKALLESGELTAGHARAVLAIEGEREQIDFARDIAARGMPKSEAERVAAARRRRPARRQSAAAAGDVHLHGICEELTRALGTRVRIHRRARGGAIEIEFYSDGELDRLVDRLRGACALNT